ncbi:hypothetical protein LTS10_000812 [Elasticomyces elasticus]|nr:hypothetical protein LTS10_000812 [Elasticomyces elasticus]
MPYSLKGRNVLVTGGSRGLGAEICRKFAAEGCNIAINYANNEAPAQELAKELQQKYNVKTVVLKADGGVLSECVNCVQETIKAFGGIDGVIGNAGWTRFTDFADLDAMSEAEWDKCYAVNVKGQHALIKEALPTFKKNAEGGFFIITSSIAGKSLGGSSMAYSVTKAAQLHLMKCVAKVAGEKARINAVLPGLLLTDWGNEYGPERINALKEAAVLKKETELGDCADAYIMLAKNTSITGQNIHVDTNTEPPARNNLNEKSDTPCNTQTMPIPSTSTQAASTADLSPTYSINSTLPLSPPTLQALGFYNELERNNGRAERREAGPNHVFKKHRLPRCNTM